MSRFDFAYAFYEADEPGLTRPRSLKIETAIRIAPDLRVQTLDWPVENAIREVCLPRTSYAPAKGFSHALIREVAAGDWDWNSGDRLGVALALSRVVAPSTHGLEASGTVTLHDGERPEVRVHGGPIAWKAPGQPWWLTERDWGRVADLFGAIDPSDEVRPWSVIRAGLPPRIAVAIAWLGRAAFYDTADVRHALLVACLEGMVSGGQKTGVKEIFRQRLESICQEIGYPITYKELGTIYDARSDVAHSAEFSDSGEVALPLYPKVDRMLAAILEKAILDLEFRDAFRSEAKLQERWPVAKRTTCQFWREDGRVSPKGCALRKEDTKETAKASPPPAQGILPRRLRRFRISWSRIQWWARWWMGLRKPKEGRTR